MAFHPYPQLIPSVFNLSGFAPPQPLTAASHWPWVDHPASGPGHATQTHSLVFAFATTTPPIGLTSRHAADSQAHSSKGTPSPQKALTDCKHTVSGTISLPSRGTFHHSLTVLIRYRSTGSIQAYQVVLADSHGISRAPCYSGNPPTAAEHISTTGLSPSTVQHPHWFVYMPAPHCAMPADMTRRGPQHRTCNPCRVSHTYGLAPSAFARHY